MTLIKRGHLVSEALLGRLSMLILKGHIHIIGKRIMSFPSCLYAQNLCVFCGLFVTGDRKEAIIFSGYTLCIGIAEMSVVTHSHD